MEVAGDASLVLHDNNERKKQILSLYVVDPAEMKTLGIKYHHFLGTFVNRTQKTCGYLVDLNLIQKGITSMQVHDGTRMFISYLGAAVAMGCLQYGYLAKGMHKKYYRQILNTLKPFYEEENTDVLLTHLVIAGFCFETGQTNEAKRHVGAARVLLQCLGDEVPENTRKSFIFVEYFGQVQSVTAKGAELDIFQLILPLIEITPQEFTQKFPLYSKYIVSETAKHMSQSTYNPNPSTNKDLASVFSVWTQLGGYVLIRLLLWTFAPYTNHLLKDMETSNHNQSLCFLELETLISAALVKYHMNVENLSSALQTSIVFDYQISRLLLLEDFEAARDVLSRMIKAWDLCMICSTLNHPSGEHKIHSLVVILSMLEMKREYNELQIKVNYALSILERPSMLSECFPDIVYGILNSACDKLECLEAWDFFPKKFLPNKNKEVNPLLQELNICSQSGHSENLELYEL